MSDDLTPIDKVNQALELPSFQVDHDGLPGGAAIRAYEEDGVVCLRGAFAKKWIDLLDSGMEEALSVPS